MFKIKFHAPHVEDRFELSASRFTEIGCIKYNVHVPTAPDKQLFLLEGMVLVFRITFKERKGGTKEGMGK